MTYEVNKATLSPVAMAIGAKPQASQGTVKESHQRRRFFSEASDAVLIKLRQYSSNTGSCHPTSNSVLSVKSVLDRLSPKQVNTARDISRAENLLEVAITNSPISPSLLVELYHKMS